MAKLKRTRIPELSLLASAFLGGGTGALLGMLLFRHKIRKWYFWAVNILGLAVQIALAACVAVIL